jgi:hypothetical protein
MLNLLAQAQGSGPELQFWQLGVVAVALMVGASAAYRWMVLPAEKRADREREERIAAQDREREAYRISTPAVLATKDVLDRVVALLPSLERRSP